eukprot:946669-Karenia_brevis.AAC.1
MSTEGVNHIARTNRGTMAGSALADLCFTVAMTKCLSRLRQSLCEAGIVCTVDSSELDPLWPSIHAKAAPSYTFTDVSFVDDTIVPVFAPASELLAKVTTALPIIHRVFSEHGFQLNYSRGKSEAMFKFFGPGSTKLKEQIMVGKGAIISFSIANGAKVMHVVSEYKHMGSKETVSGSMLLEIRRRMGEMQN